MPTFKPFKPFRFTLAFLGSLTLLIATSYLVLSATQGSGKNVVPRVGNVGIGTTEPKRGLHVQTPENHTSIGAGILMSGGLSGNANIELRNQSGGSPYIDFSNDVSGDYDMRIVQTGEDSLAVVGGNVGIGTTSPLAKLHIVENKQGLTYLDIQNINTNSAAGAIMRFITSQGSNPAVTSFDIVGYNNGFWNFGNNHSSGSIGFTIQGTQRLHIANDGLVTGDFSSLSDLRLKQNIQTLENSLAKISQLRGVSFNWQDPAKDPDPQIGVIAQEVEQVLPELVSTDEAGYKSVAYGKFVSVLLEAVKELQKEKDAEIQALTERLAALEAKLLSIK